MNPRTSKFVGRPKGMTEETKTKCKMILTWYEMGEYSIRKGCEKLKVSTRTFYDWDKKYNPKNKDKRKY